MAEQKIRVEPLNDNLFERITKRFRLYNGASEFYEKSPIRQYIGKSDEAMLGICTAGIERSNAFNSAMLESGLVTISAISMSARTEDTSTPFYSRANNGVSLVDMLEVLYDPDTTITEEGIVANKFFDKPIRHLVFIVNLDTFEVINRIGRVLNRFTHDNNPLPITVDVVGEYDVQEWERQTQKFIADQKAA